MAFSIESYGVKAEELSRSLDIEILVPTKSEGFNILDLWVKITEKKSCCVRAQTEWF